MFVRQTCFFLFTAAVLVQVSPSALHAWKLDAGTLQPVVVQRVVTFNDETAFDLNADGFADALSLSDSQAYLTSGEEVIWQSPPEWQVMQASSTDLDGDQKPEIALLVWRPFQPWPVDRWLPNGGRIAGFHDSNGSSCHIILIGWRNGVFKEVWAGSALADPVTAFTAADMNADGALELITLEGQYADSGSTPARELKIWSWNGFGFSAIDSTAGTFHTLILGKQENGQLVVITP